MILSPSESLAVAFDWAPSQLRTPVLKKGLGQIGSLLQTGVTSYYFNWHMHQENVCDLMLLINRKESVDFLARLKRERYLSKNPAWNSVIRFISSWNSEGSSLAAMIPHIWLAFDFSEKRGAFNPSNAHICIDRNFSSGTKPHSHANRLSRKQFRSVISYVTNVLTHAQTPDVLDQAERCFSLMPERGEMVCFSVMHAGDPWTMNCNMTLPKPAVMPFLKKIGWPGDRQAVAAVLDDFCPDEKHINFDIMMNKSILNRLELKLDYNAPLTADPRRERALELLCRRGCVSKSACWAVTQWPGYDWQPVKNGTWPAKIKKWLDLKVCLDEGDKMTAEAFLGFYPFFSIV